METKDFDGVVIPESIAFIDAGNLLWSHGYVDFGALMSKAHSLIAERDRRIEELESRIRELERRNPAGQATGPHVP